MKTNPLRRILNETSPDPSRRRGVVKVLVDLNVFEPDEECISRLQEMGLTINRIIKNKIIGTIHSDRLAALKADFQVNEVELSVPLEPHLGA
jgi:hypothetical protein